MTASSRTGYGTVSALTLRISPPLTLTPVIGNCAPRHEARLFETKKEGENRGRWFYRCTQTGKSKCNFFLWEDRARARESGLTPSQKALADAEVVAPTPVTPKAPASSARRMTQKSLASYGWTRRKSNSDDSTDSGASDSEAAKTPARGKRKRDELEDESDKESFGSFGSEDESELLALADEAVEKPKTPAATRIVAGLPTPSTARTLFPGAAEGRGEKRQKTTDFDDLLATPSKQPSGAPSSDTATVQAPSPATTKTVSFSSQPNPTDAVMDILQPYALKPEDASAVRNLYEVEVRKRVGAEKGREAKTQRMEEQDAKIAKLQEEVAALRNRERVMQSQITQMKAKGMRLYQDFGMI